MQNHILIIDDEASIADNLIYALSMEGFTSDWSSLGVDGIEMLKHSPSKYDLVILDVGLPDTSGFEVCKQIRAFSEVPIIFLTARGEEIDRVIGLEIGGDDYVVKPFSPRELVARVKLRLRKNKPLEPIEASIFSLDEDRHTIHFKGVLLTLTTYEFGILALLIRHQERVFTREQLMERVWREHQDSIDRVIDTHIKTIRAKLKSIDKQSSPIVTHRGLGYSLSMRG